MLKALRDFQSLIGRLATSKPRPGCSGAYRFQSLIGRLATADPVASPKQKKGFQSLIGRLATSARELEPDGLLVPLSIPHR